MVQILPLIGAAAFFAQTAFGAAVPVRRTQYNNNYNQYNQGSNEYGSQYGQQMDQESNQYGSQYGQQQNQDSNQYGYQYGQQQSQDSSQYGYQYGQQQNQEYQMTTTAEMAMETTTMMMEHSMMGDHTSMMDDTTTMMEESQMAYETSTMMEESQMADETTTSYIPYETSYAQAEETSTAYSMPSYGSGSSQWNSGYNNCVSQCMAQFGAPPSTMTMDSQDALPSATGTGAIHTVLVAPDGAGLRYVPFALNASVGDTVRYVWTTPNNHTATLSSALAICNKSGIAEQRNFVSGVRNASQGMQVFDVTVQTAEPQFFYCSVAQHCAKGMFGIINPANDVGGANTVGSMMSTWLQSNPNLQAAYSYANISESSAMNWGMGMSLDGVPESAYQDMAANVLFTQATFVANPGMMDSGLGAATPDGSPIMVPANVNVLLSSTSNVAPTTSSAPAATTPAASTPTGSLTPVNAYSSGASRSSASIWIAAVVGVAGWLLI